MSDAPAPLTVPVTVLLLILAATGAVTARRGWRGTLSRRGRLGVHAMAASASDEAFAVANKVAAPVLAGSATVALLFAVLVPLLAVPTLATVMLGVLGLLTAVLLAVIGGIIGEQAARSLPVPARRPGALGASCDGCGCGAGGCAGLTRTAIPDTADSS